MVTQGSPERQEIDMTERREPMGMGAEPSTGEKVKAKAHEAQDRVSEAASDLKDRGEQLVDEGKEMGRELADRAGDAARSRADEEKDRLAGGMRAVASALRRGSDQLPEDQRSYGRLLEGMADRVSDASRYLDDRDVNALTRDVKRVARDHSAAFLGGAFVLGMVGARFLKSSPDEARRKRDEWSGRERYPGPEDRYGHELPRGLPEPGMTGRPRLPDHGLPEPRGLDERETGLDERDTGLGDSLGGGRDARGI
jgi:hypothetical protein